MPKYPKSGFHISVLDFYGLSGGLKATSKRPSTNFVPIGHKSSFAVCSVCHSVCYVSVCFILCVVHCGTGAAVLAVTLSDLGVGTTLWGGVRSIYSSWGMSKCDHCGTEFTHIYTALRSTWSDSVTIFTVGCKGWYAISHPPNSLQHPPSPPPKYWPKPIKVSKPWVSTRHKDVGCGMLWSQKKLLLDIRSLWSGIRKKLLPDMKSFQCFILSSSNLSFRKVKPAQSSQRWKNKSAGNLKFKSVAQNFWYVLNSKKRIKVIIWRNHKWLKYSHWHWLKIKSDVEFARFFTGARFLIF